MEIFLIACTEKKSLRMQDRPFLQVSTITYYYYYIKELTSETDTVRVSATKTGRLSLKSVTVMSTATELNRFQNSIIE